MNKLFKSGYLIFIYLFLFIPIAVVVWFSFNNAAHSLIWHGFTWHWYHVLRNDNSLIGIAGNSLLVGVLAASFATIIGAIASTALFRYRFLGRQTFQGLLFALIIIPDIVMAISFLLLFRTLHLQLGFWTLLIAHISFCIPFVFITAHTRLREINPSIIEAARDLGAKEHTIFFRIIIPLLWPALMAGWLLSFTLSLDDVIISYFVTGPSFQILPLEIYSMVRRGVSPEINALCSILFIVTLVVVLSSQFLLRKK